MMATCKLESLTYFHWGEEIFYFELLVSWQNNDFPFDFRGHVLAAKTESNLMSWNKGFKQNIYFYDIKSSIFQYFIIYEYR